MLVFVEEGNWKTYKYLLRKDRWQSSGAIHSLPLAKIGGGGGGSPPPPPPKTTGNCWYLIKLSASLS